MIPVSPNRLEKLARHGIDLKNSMLPAGSKLKFPFQDQPTSTDEYPKVKYHPNRGRIVVKSAEDEAARADGWYDTPADFPPSPITERSTADKLELLESLGALIASEANEGEGLTEALYRIITERNEFAVVAAKLTGAPVKKGK
jgi:hypothetical protein